MTLCSTGQGFLVHPSCELTELVWKLISSSSIKGFQLTAREAVQDQMKCLDYDLHLHINLLKYTSSWFEMGPGCSLALRSLLRYLITQCQQDLDLIPVLTQLLRVSESGLCATVGQKQPYTHNTWMSVSVLIHFNFIYLSCVVNFIFIYCFNHLQM